jgi:hypothetical protein
MTEYNILTEQEAELLDNYLLVNLEKLNATLNLPKHKFSSHHFYLAIDNAFPTWRSEQLANIDENNYANTNIAYNHYMERFNK